MVTTLGACQKDHLSSAEENVPSVLKLVTCAVVHGMPASISSAFGLWYPSWHPDNYVFTSFGHSYAPLPVTGFIINLSTFRGAYQFMTYEGIFILASFLNCP